MNNENLNEGFLQEQEEAVNISEVEESLDKNSTLEESDDKKDKKTIKVEIPSSIGLVLVGLIDQVVCISIGVIALFLFNLLLNLFGFRVKEMQIVPMFLIMYIITNVLFLVICRVCKFKGTFGSKIVYND